MSTMFGVYGAVDFGPDGTEFLEPVTITIPSNTPLTPGAQFLLYFWNPDESAWEETEFLATVNTDGLSSTADVTHFSTYTGTVQVGPDGNFSELIADIQWIEKDFHHDVLFNSWLLKTIPGGSPVNEIKRLEDCCWKCVGIQWKYEFKSYNTGYEYKKKNPEEDIGDDDYDWKERSQIKRLYYNNDYCFEASIEKYWKLKDRDVKILPTDITNFNIDCDDNKEQEFTVSVKCGEESIPGANVEFFLDGPGALVPDVTTTDDKGEATATYTASEKGKAYVSADVKTCQNEPGGDTATVEAGEICVKDCSKQKVTGYVEFAHSGDDVSWIFSDNINFKIVFTVDENGTIVSEDGEANHFISVDSAHSNCSILNLNAPDFPIRIGGAMHDDLIFWILPEWLLVDFTYYCEIDGQEAINQSVPAYSYFEDSIIGKYLNALTVPKNNYCSTWALPGSGSEDFGAGSIPVIFSYEIVVGCEGSCE